MRPVSVRFKCFGPYVQEQFVDFSELDRIFAISGETGSGKTTILDVMCYALYGSSSSGDRGEFSAMRCQLSKDDEDTFVEFIFEENGKKYRFGRCYAKARSKFNETYICDEETEDGWKPVAANIKKSTMLQQAEAILHLNADQFRQIIILPQGKFESFLVSDSKVKESVLESIFDASRWGEIAEKVAKSVEIREKALREKEARLEGLLHMHECDSEDALRNLESETAQSLGDSQNELKKKNDELQAVQEEYDSALKDENIFAELDGREKELQSLENKKEFWAGERRKLDRVRAAQDISEVYEHFLASREKAGELKNIESSAEKRLKKASGELEEVKAEIDMHNKGENQQNQRISRKNLLENAKETYADIGKLKQQLETAQTGFDSADCAVALEKKKLHQAETERNATLDKSKKAERKYYEALSAYQHGIAGELAGTLRENKPCPVCGSYNHPDPAVCSENHVSREQLDDIEIEKNEASDNWKDAEEKLKKVQQSLEEKNVILSNANAELAAANAALRSAEKNLIEGIADEDARVQELQSLNGMISAYLEKTRILGEKHTDAISEKKSADEAFVKAKADHTEAENQLNSALTAWQQALACSDFTDEKAFLSSRLSAEERDELNNRITAYNTKLSSAERRLSEQKKLCEGKQRPDIAAVKAKKKEAEEAKTGLDKKCDRLQGQLDAIKNDLAEYTEKRPVLREERRLLDNDNLFAERLRGNKGVSIKRYVLGIMMTMIISQANGFLKNIYGGRYRLHKAAAE